MDLQWESLGMNVMIMNQKKSKYTLWNNKPRETKRKKITSVPCDATTGVNAEGFRVPNVVNSDFNQSVQTYILTDVLGFCALNVQYS